MAKFQFRGLEEYAQMLQEIGANTQEICGVGVYAMAEIVANQIRQNLDALPAEPDIEGLAAWREKRKARLTESEKKGLQDGFGVTPMENTDGYWNVKLGFDGYNSVKTKKYPQGQPNVMIARATESGSSVREKTPFIRRAVSSTQKKAVKKCKEVIDQEIEKKMK